MEIVVLDGYTLNPGDLSWNELMKMGKLSVYDRTPIGEVITRIGNADVVFTNKTVIDRNVMEHCPSIRYIGVLATGYNVVDTVAASEKGISVCNVPGYGTNTVAQAAFAMLLSVCHHIQEHSEAVHHGEWQKRGDFCFWNYPIMELAGKTMGIIGFGHIGQAVGRIAKAFGMRVLATGSKPTDEGRKIAEYVDLKELLSNSDVISLHCPLTNDNMNLINHNTIAQMKDEAILINTARGGLICEQDVVDALKSGKLSAFAADVVSAEPISNDNPLLVAPNCYITPHIAWASYEARSRLMQIAIENLQNFVAGNPQNVVNP